MISSCKKKKKKENPIRSKIYARASTPRASCSGRDRTFAIADAIQVSRRYFSFLSSPSPLLNSPQLRVDARRPRGSSDAPTPHRNSANSTRSHRNRPRLVFLFNPAILVLGKLSFFLSAINTHFSNPFIVEPRSRDFPPLKFPLVGLSRC